MAPTPSWLVEVPLAHRGLHGPGVPENTAAAFAAARAAGVGVELDVRLAADGVPVVVHDRGLDRLAGMPGWVADHSSDDLARLRIAGTDEGVPSLARALAVLGDTPTMVEVKAESLRSTALEPAVAGVLATHPGPTCVASFSPMSLRWFRRWAPDVVRVLTSAPTTLALGGRDRWLANLQTVGMVDPAAVSYDVHGLHLRAVRRHRDAGGRVVTWTVRTDDDLTTARAAADNVIFEGLDVADVRD